MEKSSSLKQPALLQSLPQQLLSPQEWEALIEDFQSGDSLRQFHWLTKHSAPLCLLDLAIASLLRRDFPSKLLLILFLEEFGHLLVHSPEDHAASALSSLSEALAIVLQLPADSFPGILALKEQIMVAVTSISITIDGLLHAPRQIEAIVEILLGVINRPNHSSDRQSRAIACDCLRELEKAFPCLLSEIVGHIWNLCQSERTHASQSYILLLTTVVHNIVHHPIPPSATGILSTSIQFVPFNIPANLENFDSSSRRTQDLSEENLRDVRKVMAFLLERPMILTPQGVAEMISMLARIVKSLESQISAATALLKVQFSGLLYSFDPTLIHVVLILHSNFSDAFSGDEREIARRLSLLPKETQQPLIFRLLSLHWLLAIANRKNNLLISSPSTFYPSLFDPLALKAAKLDVLSIISSSVDSSISAQLFQDSLVCVSAFKWLPPWSTETLVFFRNLYKFLTGAASGSISDDSTVLPRMESTTFITLQNILIEMVLEHPRLVSIVASFLDRLKNGSKINMLLGDRLLQTFDEFLLPKLQLNPRTSTYFPILERIAENRKIPPRGLLRFLLQLIAFLAKNHGPDSGTRSWSNGSKILRICRIMMMAHHGSRIFQPLSHLLSFISQCYPDLEVRDSARYFVTTRLNDNHVLHHSDHLSLLRRIYLRMLLCIPGKKLRNLLNPVEQPTAVAPSPDAGFFYRTKSPIPSSFIHLERSIPLLLNQSWALTKVDEPSSPGPIKDPSGPDEFEGNLARISLAQEPPRVVDPKTARILQTLRTHFGSIPDFRHVAGLKVRIPCTLRLDSGVSLYAIVLTFKSSANYGPIPARRVPFLLGEDPASHQAIVPIESSRNKKWRNSRAEMEIEIEPHEPMPGMIIVTIDANADDGRMITGELDSVPVGIEDMFMRCPIPEEVSENDASVYLLDLFNALWEACSSSSSTARETFPLKGGRGVAAVNGTGSVKLLYSAAKDFIAAVRRRLGLFIVSISGGTLGSSDGTLMIEYLKEEERERTVVVDSRELGCVLVLVFLPPRFHLLFRMEISEKSTLARIKTDHWPCLAFVDEFLESLCSSA